MRKTTRLTLVAAVGATALATAGSAFAAFAPSLTVSGSTTGGATVDARVGAADDPTARVTIYVPNGYTATPANPGTRLGDVKATAQAADLGGATLPLTGDLLAVDPAQFATAQAACGVSSVLSTWDLHLTAAGQTLDIPMFLVATAGTPEAVVGAAKLVVCLPPPDVPVGTPGRAQFGAKLLSATFTTSAIAPPTTAGEFRWTSAWTPYTPNTGRPNPAGSVEVQSLVRTPTTVKLTAKKKKVVKKAGKKQLVTTQVSALALLTENADPVSGANVTMTVNGRRLGTTKTASTGTASARFTIAKGTATLAATAVVPARDLGVAGCVKTAIFGGIPCSDATVGGTTVRATTKVVAFKK
jgi:hypothetical protein